MRKGNKYYNNGSVEICVMEGESIPEGFSKGRLTANSIHVHKENISKRIHEDKLEEYLNDGWMIGRAKFSEEAIKNIRDSRFRFFDKNPHWRNSTTWVCGMNTWNKGIPMSDEAKKKLSESRKGTHLSEKSRLIKNENEYNTKKKNNSFNRSNPEDDLYRELLKIFDERDVVRQYRDIRYPFNCDIYIKSIDLFIECNFHWTHGGHPYDPNSEEDLDKLKNIVSKQKEYLSKSGKIKKNSYYVAEHVWTISDPLKSNTAKTNNLNYVVLYNEEQENDFIRGIQEYCR